MPRVDESCRGWRVFGDRRRGRAAAVRWCASVRSGWNRHDVRVIDTRDELVAALVDFGLPAADLPIDDSHALIEVANKIVRDALTVED